MSDFRARAFTEHDELHQRIEKLTNFIVTPAFDALPEIERGDLKEQLQHMKAYHATLARRVSRMCNNA